MAIPPTESEVRLRTLSSWHRIVLVLALPLSVLSAVTVPLAMWQKAGEFHADGDIARCWLNGIGSVVLGFILVSWFVVSLHLLLKTVSVSSSGIRFGGLVGAQLSWDQIRDAKIEVAQHTASLMLWSIDGRRREVGIGDQQTAALCHLIVKAVEEKKAVAGTD